MAKVPDEPLSEVEQNKLTRVLKGIEGHIQGRTLAGLMQMVPLLVTIAVILFIVNHVDSVIRPLAFVRDRPWDFTGIGLLVLVAVFYVVGLVTSLPLGQRALDLLDKLMKSIPVVKIIFGVTHQATTALTSRYNFSRVVFLEWPREGMAALGFVTGRVYSTERDESLVLVYIPTIPNPTSGNMALVPEDDVLETDLTVDVAMKLVFSGGIVLPDSISLARVPSTEADNPLLVGRFKSKPD